MPDPDEGKCRFCRLRIENVQGVWVVLGTNTTADGLTYCPPNPDYAGPFHDHEIGAEQSESKI